MINIRTLKNESAGPDVAVADEQRHTKWLSLGKKRERRDEWKKGILKGQALKKHVYLQRFICRKGRACKEDIKLLRLCKS